MEKLFICWKRFSVVSAEECPDGYSEVPPWMMLLIGPVLGGAFVLFLPFIGFWMVGKFAFLWLAERTAIGRVINPAWTFGEAFLAKVDKWEKETEEILKDQ